MKTALTHMEPDVQVTLRTFCLLHNAPAQQGRERRNGWFSVQAFCFKKQVGGGGNFMYH